MKRITATAMVAALLLALAAPAGAIAPERFEDSGGWSEFFAACDGFDVVADLEFSIRGAVFTRPDGLEVQEHWKLSAAVHRDSVQVSPPMRRAVNE